MENLTKEYLEAEKHFKDVRIKVLAKMKELGIFFFMLEDGRYLRRAEPKISDRLWISKEKEKEEPAE